jgi:hypothetical protein
LEFSLRQCQTTVDSGQRFPNQSNDLAEFVVAHIGEQRQIEHMAAQPGGIGTTHFAFEISLGFMLGEPSPFLISPEVRY